MDYSAAITQLRGTLQNLDKTVAQLSADVC